LAARAVTNAATGSAVVTTIIANSEVQAIGKAIFDGVPALMNGLEALTSVHPFLAGFCSIFPVVCLLTDPLFSGFHPFQTYL
jgi:hypothetical protein